MCIQAGFGDFSVLEGYDIMLALHVLEHVADPMLAQRHIAS
jgi:2-polyprenyl-3-methyl-5-hydroxy-6-metoxy-1,4-benzoquinol methylase